MLRFHLFGIPFEVGPYFWIGSALFGSNLAQGNRGLILLAIWVLCVFVSIVVHELGHALVARRFGSTPHVILQMLGGVTVMPGASLTRGQGMLVTIAGPAAGLALWALITFTYRPLLLPLFGASPDMRFACHSLVFINLIWTLFNLLPVLPLDGGQLLRNVLGPGRVFVARLIGGGVAAVCCALFLVAGQVYMGLFMGALAWSNFQPAGGLRAL